MSRWLPLWLLLAFAAAFGMNHLTRARVPYELSAGERTMATGSLSFEDTDGHHELKLVTIHVVARDVHRNFGPPLIVRELWLRSPEQDAHSPPDLELFIDFDREGHTPSLDSHQVELVTQRALPVLPLALGSQARSQIRFAGAPAPVFVSDGQLSIQHALTLEGQSSPSWRVDGDLDLSLPDAAGGTAARHVHGTLNARLVWD